MAETKRRGRPPKSETTPKVEEKKTDNSQDELIKKLMAQIEAQNIKMAEMQKQIESKSQPVVVSNNNESIRGKKVKVVNLMQNPLNISTEPNGGGRTYSFKNYGDSRLIKFDDLADIVASEETVTKQKIVSEKAKTTTVKNLKHKNYEQRKDINWNEFYDNI